MSLAILRRVKGILPWMSVSCEVCCCNESAKMSYQIAYCDSKSWKSGPLQDQVERTFRWYLLECLLVGIVTLGIAREMAIRETKARFGPRAQVIIFGLEKGQHVGVDADSILGITVLQGANATECEAPNIVFGRGKKAVFYSRPEDLKIGKPW